MSRRRRGEGGEMPYGVKARAGPAALGVVLSSVVLGLGAGASAGAATTHDISMIGTAFSPKTLTVQQGDTVIWTNNSGLPHTVTADDGSFASGSVSPGQTFSHTFATAGTMAYHCSFHGAAGGIGMAGTIVVQSSAPPTTAAPVTTPAAAPATTTPTAAPVAPGVPVAPVPSPAPTAGRAPGAPVADAPTAATQPQLARTGTNDTPLLAVAAVLSLTGAMAVVAGRRRSRGGAPG